jgi:hypothetical protein
MYLKCFFSSRGHVIVKSIFSPASQCNIEGSGGIISGLKARYTQAKRHLWGSLDFGYACRKIIYSFVAQEGVDYKALAASVFGLIEIHIFPGHLLPMLFVSSILPNTSLWSHVSESEPHPILLSAISIGKMFRLCTAVWTIIIAVYYEKYHQWVGAERWLNTGHLGKRSRLQSLRTKFDVIDFFLLGITSIIYGILPLYHAQISHIFTDRLDYEVASKPAMSYIESNSDSDGGFYSVSDEAEDNVVLPVQ